MADKNSLQNKFRDSINFYESFSDIQLKDIRKNVYDAPLEQRESIWKSLFSPHTNLQKDKIEKLFIKMSIERERFAIDKGYKSAIDMFLDRYKIPNNEYLKFLKNVDKVIEICNKNLPPKKDLSTLFYSEFSGTCFICNQKDFPFKDIKSVQKYFEDNYKNVKKYKNKIVIKSGEKSEMIYKKESDTFEIYLGTSLNSRHKIADLLHELCHVETHLKYLSNGVNPQEVGMYEREKSSTKLEFEILSRDFPELYNSTLGNVLRIFKMTLFEIELYKNQDRDLSKLYAECFNRCYRDGNQKTNPTYLIEPEIILTHFTKMAHTIAFANLLIG